MHSRHTYNFGWECITTKIFTKILYVDQIFEMLLSDKIDYIVFLIHKT